MEEVAQYNTKPAGLFHAMANEPITIWFYCGHCFDRQNQKFLRDEDNYEVYECQNCHQVNKVAVR